MQCIAYRSGRRASTYVYVADPAALEKLPAPLRQALGALVEVLRFELTAERRMASEDPRRVLANIEAIGYHVQFPPAEAVPPPDPTA